VRRLNLVLARASRNTSDTVAAWSSRRANLVVKNTISSKAEALLQPSTSQWSLSQLFTHRVLFLRDPVQQYLSARLKSWCHNCGGFMAKLGAQERLLQSCLAVSSRPHSSGMSMTSEEAASSCPFDIVLFDRDILAAAEAGVLPAFFARLGLVPASVASAYGSQRVRVQVQVRRERNRQLSLAAKLVSLGNMHGDSFTPHLVMRRASWSCDVASRVKELMPTLYGIYHPLHCSDARVRNDSLVEVHDWIDSTSRRRSSRRWSQLSKAFVKWALVCDTYTDRDAPDCTAAPKKSRQACEDTLKDTAWLSPSPTATRAKRLPL